MTLRHAMCNEAFEGRGFAETCRAIRKVGYGGIEIAPFTLAEDPREISQDRRRELRETISSEGLAFAGLHWLMVSPKGLHLTTPDAALRERSWGHIRSLIDLCGDLGPAGVMVLGSPKQRCATGGLSPREATRLLADGLAAVSPQAADRGVTLLLEALPENQCDVVQTLEEAVGIVRDIGSPGLCTMFDVHNAIDEGEAHERLIERHFEYIRHVHVNELDGRHCGAGDYDFTPVLAALMRLRYRGWVSLEAFDFSPGAERLAEESLRHLERATEKIAA
ncbi:MAG TPA: sugar phosphate isomerase/epimerase family protein [Verrucomicrobiae bacterium]|nr:sugar phosphate isomerase/epimerase family protein [Verrucomicrobiae bacterium]